MPAKLKRPYEGMYNSFRYYALYAKHAFELSYEDFLALIKAGECFYCAEKLFWAEHGRMSGYQVDRLDNAVGYIKSNSVACCKSCNFAKRNLPVKTFYKWAVRLVANLKKRKLVRISQEYQRSH